MKDLKEKSKKNFTTIGWYVRRYRILYLIVASVIALLELVLLIRGFIIFDFSKAKHIAFIILYSILFVSSVISVIVLLLIKKKNIGPYFLALFLHLYSAILVLWGAGISIIDIGSGGYPIVYLTIIITIGGIVAVNPVFYAVVVISTFAVICVFLNKTGLYDLGDYFNLIVFLAMSLFVDYRHYSVTLIESKFKDYLKKTSFTDHLTGLNNEASYFKSIETIDKEYDKYMIVVMDINGLKLTNDAYGHHYGCHLVVETGHILPKIFKNSRLFHVGGDEFVAILINEDYDNREELLKEFDNQLVNQMIEFDGKTLQLSVARGYAEKKDNLIYKEVFQLADDMMYQNKEEVKKLLNIPNRK